MFAVTDNFVILLLAGIVGVISTSGGEIGPFVSVEQASLTDTLIVKYGEEKVKEKIPFPSVLFGFITSMPWVSE